MKNKDFEQDSCKTNDLDENPEDIEELINYLKALPRCDKHILNPLRFYQIESSEQLLRQLLHESNNDVEVSSKQSEFNPCIGSISIEGGDVVIHDIQMFAKAIEYADNLDIHPLSNGNIRVTLTFHKMAIPVRDKTNL